MRLWLAVLSFICLAEKGYLIRITRIKSIIFSLLIGVLLLLFVVPGCAGSVPSTTPTSSPIPSMPTLTPTLAPSTMPTPTPKLTAAPTPTPQEVITAMTYNILNGGGAGPTDPNGPWCCAGRGCCGAAGGNRLPLLLEIMKTADPDILGVQEAYLWQQDNDAIARQVAQELGMNYYIGASGIPDGGHVVLFTKFKIIEARNYPDHFTSPVIRGCLHAVLTTDGGNTLHIFVVHLRPDSTVEDETSFLAQVAEPYLNDLTIIMGDMNFSETSSQASRLRESGWRLPVATGVDHIWVSPKLAPYVERGSSLNHFNLAAASDHDPVIAEISIYPP